MPTLTPSTTHPQRAPPPSLFLGPPSRNASNVSLAPPSTSNATSSTPQRAPLLRSRSARGPDTSSSSPLRPPRPQLSTTQTEGDRTDALWAEMQARLAEVEVSAFTSTHVFGAAHAQALEELRTAQMGLAQAWGKEVRESDAVDETPADNGKDKNDKGDEGDGNEEDILVAKRRREENERVFGKVREGAQDLGRRLDEVANAMGKVERESREIWSGSESIGSGIGSVNS
ncbi:hypothetical protein MMC07_008767 [Pseudocyphellaria aurata]|nr:hypothetical protein [Pseudocyphellaria aurata]